MPLRMGPASSRAATVVSPFSRLYRAAGLPATSRPSSTRTRRTSQPAWLLASMRSTRKPVGSQAQPVAARVDGQPRRAGEAHQRQAGLGGQLDRQRRRRRHRDQGRQPGHHGLLHQLEAGPPADHQDVPGQRQPPLAAGPADHLVDGVVPADVLAHDQRLAVGGEDPGRVQAAGLVEDLLPGPQRVGQPGHHGR